MSVTDDDGTRVGAVRHGPGRPPRLTPKRVWGGLVAVTTVLVTLTTLFDWFEGKVDKPAPPPPQRIDPRIDFARMDPVRERFGDFLAEAGHSADGLSREEAAEEGMVFRVRVTLRGRAGERIRLRWRMYGARGRRVPEYSAISGEYTTRGEAHSNTSPVWIPYPPRPGRYLMKFTLLSRDDKTLDEVVTPRFRVSAGDLA